MSQNIGKQKTKHIGRKSKAAIAAVAGASLLFLIATVAFGNGVMSFGSGGKASQPNGGGEGGQGQGGEGGATGSPAIKGLRAMDNEHCVNKLGGPALC